MPTAKKKNSLADTPLIDKRPRAKKKSVKELEKLDDDRRKNSRAVWLQLFVDEHYGLDIASYQSGEIESLSRKLAEFVALGVETEDLKPADEYTSEEASRAGYRP